MQDAGSTLAPVLVLDAPADGLITGAGSVALTGEIREGTPPFALTVNGAALGLNGTRFATSLDLPEGDHTVTVQVQDAEQRVATLTRTVTVDTTPPALAISHPFSSPEQTTESPYLVIGTASDPNLSSVTVNGAPALVLAGTFSLPVALDAGTNVILVQAMDLAGNVSTLDRSLEIASVPPQVLKPVTLTFPNRTSLPAGRMVVVLGFDTDRLALQRVALGHVSADGTAITADAPVQLTSLDLVGYMALSQAEQSQVEAALASLAASQGTPDGGLGLRGLPPLHKSGWERVLNAVLPSAHAQFFVAPFTFAMAALDSMPQGTATVFGTVRAPRANELKVELAAPPPDALPHDQPVNLPYALPVSFTGHYVSNDPIIAGGHPPTDVVAEVHAVGSDGKVVSAPDGQDWTADGQDEVTLATQVPVGLGTTQIELTVLAGASSRTVRLNAVVTPEGDGGTETGRLTLTQLADPSDEVDPLGGSAYFSGVRVDLTSASEGVAVTGGTGSYYTPLAVPGENTMGISCAQLALGSRSIAWLDGGSTLYTKVDPNFYACSPTYSIDPGSSMRADILIDVRYLTGKLQFRNRDGTPVPGLCSSEESGDEDAGTVWSQGGAALSRLSSEDVATTEVHFFREGDLETPIAKYAVAEPTPVDCADGAAPSGAQAKFSRLWVGPANPSSASTRVRCKALTDATARSPADEAFFKTQCQSDQGSFTRLSPGDRLVVFAINHATGYAGEATVVVPPIERQPGAPDGGCPADDQAGGPLEVNQGGETVTLSRCAQEDVTIPANVDLYPPELDVRVARAAEDDGVPGPTQANPPADLGDGGDLTAAGQARAHLIRTGGEGTTRDDFIQISTDWRVRLAPAGTSAAGGDAGTAAAAIERCVQGKLGDGGDCLPGVLVDEAYDSEGNPLDAGERLEVFCSELPPTADGESRTHCLKDAKELVDVPEGVPPLAGQVIAVTGTAVEQPAVAVFPVKPGRATANVQTSLRRVNADGKHETLNNLKRANYYVHVVGNRLLGRDTDGDGIVSAKENDARPPDFSQTLDPTADGGLPGMPDKALWVKAVYRHLEGGATPVDRYDRAREHEFRVVEVTLKNVAGQSVAGTHELYPDGGTAPAALPDDLEYQFLAEVLEDGPARAGTMTGDYQVRLGSDDFGVDCPIHLDEGSHTLSASCENGYLPDVLSASDLLYLEVYLSGNAENVLYRFNFNGLSGRKDLVSTNTAYTADAAETPDTDGKPAVGRPVATPPVANFYVSPAQMRTGTISVCSDDDCLGDSLLKEATVALQADGRYQVTDTGAGTVEAGFNLSSTLGADGAQLFRLPLPVDLASMPLKGSVAKTVSLKLTPSDSRPPVSLKLGEPKGGFDGRNAVSPGHASRDGIDVADGHLSLDYTDFSLPFNAGALAFTRTFNNQDNALRPLGLGWSDNYDGWVIEERPGRYAVVLGGQAYSFPECGTVPTDPEHRGNASDCKTDKSHGMTLEVTAPLKLPEGTEPADHVKVTTADGWEYDFDKPVGLRMEGRRKWLLTRFADAHRNDNNDAAWMELTYGQGDRLEDVKRHDGAAKVHFTYEDVDPQDPDVSEGVKLLARHGFAWLAGVEVTVGDQQPYSVSFQHDGHGNLTRAATNGGAAPYPIWTYDYAPPPDELSDDQKWAAANELTDAHLIHGDSLEADAPLQWKAHYARAVDEAPYEQELALEVVTSVVTTGMQGTPLELNFSGTTERTVEHPDGVTEGFTLNQYGNAKGIVLPVGTASSTWGSDTLGGNVFREQNTTPAGYGTETTPTDRLIPQSVSLASSPVGALPVQGQTSPLITQVINPNLGLPEGGSVASNGSPLAFSTPRTLGGDLSEMTVGAGSATKALLSNAIYNPDGVLQSATDAQGRQWTFSSFNALGEPQQAQATLPGATGLGTLSRTMVYDPQGRLTSVLESPTGALETWSHDGLGRVTQHLIAGTPQEAWSYTYEASDLTLAVTEALAKGTVNEQAAWSKTTTYTEATVTESFPGPNGPVQRVTQLDHGHPSSMTDELGQTWLYGYDSNQHLIDVSVNNLAVKHDTVDPEGRVLAETDALGAVTTFGYDQLGRAVQQNYGDGDVVTTLLDARGAVIKRSYANDAHAVLFSADALGNVASATSAGGVSTETISDSAGRTVRFEDHTRGLVETYAYADVLGRLTEYTRSITSGATPLQLTETRAYDDTSHTIGVTRTISTGLAEAAATRVETEALTTDVRGRVLAATKNVDGTDATTTYEYDEHGQVWRTTSPLNEVTTREFDAKEQLIGETDADGNRTVYHRDDAEHLIGESAEPVNESETVFV